LVPGSGSFKTTARLCFRRIASTIIRSGGTDMKKIIGVLFSATVIFSCAGIASAQDMPPQGPPPGGGQGGMRMQMPSFKDYDKNKDGKLSKEEVKDSQMLSAQFDRLDENKDGFIDETEWNNIMSRFRGGAGGGARFGEMFLKAMDGNGDSKLSREEFAKIVALFDILDKNKDGELSQEELGQFFGAVNQMGTEAQNKSTGGVSVDQLFTNLDKNKDGKITPDEMTNEKTFKALDLNKDGVITKEEAADALKKQAERRKSSTPQ
jgi:Ca2+-binding EF-hand superfamily protein